MERIIRFVGLVVLMEVATAIAIKLTGGSPFSSMSGWKGLAALLGLVLVLGLVAAGLWVLGKNSFDTETLLILVAVGTAGIAAIGFVGFKWLMEPMRDLAEGGGIWWPIVVFGACVIAWLARLGRN